MAVERIPPPKITYLIPIRLHLDVYGAKTLSYWACQMRLGACRRFETAVNVIICPDMIAYVVAKCSVGSAQLYRVNSMQSPT